MRRALFVFLGILATAAAEDRPLQPVNRPVIAGEVRCLPFFVVTTFGGIAAEQIVFSYQAQDGSTKRDTVPKSRTLVQIHEGPTPTYEKTLVDGQNGVMFRLSQVEYEKAHACLPEAVKAAQ